MEWIQFTMLIITLIAMHRQSAAESKDFHGRLCTLQQQYMDMMERVLRDKK